jgi:hypothetical protein
MESEEKKGAQAKEKHPSMCLEPHTLLPVILECNELTRDETTSLKYESKDFMTIR